VSALVTELRAGIEFCLTIRTRLLLLLSSALVAELRALRKWSATLDARNLRCRNIHLRPTLVTELRDRFVCPAALRTRNTTGCTFTS